MSRAESHAAATSNGGTAVATSNGGSGHVAVATGNRAAASITNQSSEFDVERMLTAVHESCFKTQPGVAPASNAVLQRCLLFARVTRLLHDTLPLKAFVDVVSRFDPAATRDASELSTSQGARPSPFVMPYEAVCGLVEVLARRRHGTLPPQAALHRLLVHDIMPCLRPGGVLLQQLQEHTQPHVVELCSPALTRVLIAHDKLLRALFRLRTDAWHNTAATPTSSSPLPYRREPRVSVRGVASLLYELGVSRRVVPPPRLHDLTARVAEAKHPLHFAAFVDALALGALVGFAHGVVPPTTPVDRAQAPLLPPRVRVLTLIERIHAHLSSMVTAPAPRKAHTPQRPPLPAPALAPSVAPTPPATPARQPTSAATPTPARQPTSAATTPTQPLPTTTPAPASATSSTLAIDKLFVEFHRQAAAKGRVTLSLARPRWDLATFLLFCRQCRAFCNTLTHADAINVFSLATRDASDGLLAWQPFVDVALPGVATATMPHAPSAKLALAAFRRRHLQPLLAHQLDTRCTVSSLLASTDAMSLFQLHAVPLQYLFFLYSTAPLAGAHTRQRRPAAVTWHADLSDAAAASRRMPISSFLRMCADFGLVPQGADAVPSSSPSPVDDSRAVPTRAPHTRNGTTAHLVVSEVTALLLAIAQSHASPDRTASQSAMFYPAFCEALFAVSLLLHRSRVVAPQQQESKDTPAHALRHLFRTMDPVGTIFKHTAAAFSTGGVAMASGRTHGTPGAAGTTTTYVSVLDVARHVHTTPQDTIRHVEHNLREVYELIVDAQAALQARSRARAPSVASRRPHHATSNARDTRAVSRATFATFARCTGLVRNQLTQAIVNTIFTAAAASSLAMHQLQVAAGGRSTPAPAQASTEHLTLEGFTTAILSCCQVAMPGTAIDHAVKWLLAQFLRHYDSAAVGAALPDVSEPAAPGDAVAAVTGRALLRHLVEPDVLAIVALHEPAIERVFCMFASRPSGRSAPAPALVLSPSRSATRASFSGTRQSPARDAAAASHTVGFVAAVQVAQLAGLCPTYLSLKRLRTIFRRCSRPFPAPASRGGGDAPLSRTTAAATSASPSVAAAVDATLTGLSFAAFVEFLLRCVLRLPARDSLAVLSRRARRGSPRDIVIGLRMYGVRTQATRVNSLLLFLLDTIESSVEAALAEETARKRPAAPIVSKSHPGPDRVEQDALNAPSPTAASEVMSLPPSDHGTAALHDAPHIPPLDDAELRDLFLARAVRTSAVHTHRPVLVWQPLACVRFCRDVGLTLPPAAAPSHATAASTASDVDFPTWVTAMHGTWCRWTGTRATLPAPLSEGTIHAVAKAYEDESIATALAETPHLDSARSLHDERRKRARGAISPWEEGAAAGLPFRAVLSLLGDVASMVFVGQPSPGVLLRQYLAVVMHLSSRAPRGGTGALPDDGAGVHDDASDTHSSWGSWGPDASPTLKQSARDTPRVAASSTRSRRVLAADGPVGMRALDVAPRVGLPVSHEAALRHIFARYCESDVARRTTTNGGEPATPVAAADKRSELLSAMSRLMLRGSGGDEPTLPVDAALQFLADFGAFGTLTDEATAAALVHCRPVDELVRNSKTWLHGGTPEETDTTTPVPNLTFIAFVHLLQRVADAAFARDGLWQASASSLPWVRLQTFLFALNTGEELLFTREPDVAFPAPLPSQSHHVAFPAPLPSQSHHAALPTPSSANPPAAHVQATAMSTPVLPPAAAQPAASLATGGARHTSPAIDDSALPPTSRMGTPPGARPQGQPGRPRNDDGGDGDSASQPPSVWSRRASVGSTFSASNDVGRSKPPPRSRRPHRRPQPLAAPMLTVPTPARVGSRRHSPHRATPLHHGMERTPPAMATADTDVSVDLSGWLGEGKGRGASASVSTAEEGMFGDDISDEPLRSPLSLAHLSRRLMQAQVLPHRIAPAALRAAFDSHARPSPHSALPVDLRESVITTASQLRATVASALRRTTSSDTGVTAVATTDVEVILRMLWKADLPAATAEGDHDDGSGPQDVLAQVDIHDSAVTDVQGAAIEETKGTVVEGEHLDDTVVVEQTKGTVAVETVQWKSTVRVETAQAKGAVRVEARQAKGAVGVEARQAKGAVGVETRQLTGGGDDVTDVEVFDYIMCPEVVDVLSRLRPTLQHVVATLGTPLPPPLHALIAERQLLRALERTSLLEGFCMPATAFRRVYLLAALGNGGVLQKGGEGKDAATALSLSPAGVEELLCRMVLHAWRAEGLPGGCPSELAARGIDAAVQRLSQLVSHGK